jgi:hypothetical protein
VAERVSDARVRLYGPATLPGPPEPAPLGPTLALVVALAFGGFAVVMSLVMLIHRPTPLPMPFPSLGLPSQNQRAETLSYLLAFAVVLPAALLAAPRLARAVAAGPNAPGLPILTGGVAGSLALVLLGLRLAGAVHLPDGMKTLLLLAAVWWAVVASALARATRPRPWGALLRLAPWASSAWAGAAVLTLGVVLTVTRLRDLSPVGVGAGAMASLAVLWADRRRAPRRLARPWGAVVDAVVVAGILALVPDLHIFRAAHGDLDIAVETRIIGFHQDFLLGPANQVLHGGTLLVDTASQYGVGSIYALVAWFHLVPIGYGTLGFLDDVLTALWFAAGYGILRMAGVSRFISASALGVAIVALVFHLGYPVGAVPQDGPLRFGLPMAVLVTSLAGERWPRRASAARTATLVTLGLSAVWSLEGFVYTAAVYATVVAHQAWLRREPGRRRWLARQIGLALLACLAAHAILAGATLATAGRLPQWNQYLAYLHAFLFGGLGNLTYDVGRWSPGLAVGAVYLASAGAVVELSRRRHAVAALGRPALVAQAGVTAYGILLFSYFVDRSLRDILMHVAFPAVLVGALWLSCVLRARPTLPRAVRRGALVSSLVVAALLVSVAWSSIGARLPRTPLAHAMPSGQTLPVALHRLWHPPPLDAAAVEGQRLLARDMPGERHSLVVTLPDLETEILIRSHRADRLLLGDPVETSFVAGPELPRLRAALARLRPGDRMLLDGAGRRALAEARRPVTEPRPGESPSASLIPRSLAGLQLYALKRIQERFHTRVIERGAQGLSVVELAARR